jgi:hypothetical protein
VSLWIEARSPDGRSSFLDAHVKVGNSLQGTTPALLAAGIPDAALSRRSRATTGNMPLP